MRLYGKAILTDYLKESYFKNTVCDIPEYKFALMTDSHAGYKKLRELLVKTDLNAGRNQNLKSSTTKNQSQYKLSIQYRENQETLVLYTSSESDYARHLWSDFESDTCLCHPNQTIERPHSTLECGFHLDNEPDKLQPSRGSDLDMDKIRSHLDNEPDKLLAFKRQWLRLHPNAYKSSLVSSTSNRREGSSKPNKFNKKLQFWDDKPSTNLSEYGPAPDPKKNRPTTSSVYCNICKAAGKPENVWSNHHTMYCPNNTNPSGKDLERKLRDDFKGRNSYYAGSGGYYSGKEPQ
jgi:hypothetical protein